jgi:hypothetical protein
MSAKARARVREKFTMRIMGLAFDSFYQQAAALHAPSAPRTTGG